MVFPPITCPLSPEELLSLFAEIPLRKRSDKADLHEQSHHCLGCRNYSQWIVERDAITRTPPGKNPRP